MGHTDVPKETGLVRIGGIGTRNCQLRSPTFPAFRCPANIHATGWTSGIACHGVDQVGSGLRRLRRRSWKQRLETEVHPVFRVILARIEESNDRVTEARRVSDGACFVIRLTARDQCHVRRRQPVRAPAVRPCGGVDVDEPAVIHNAHRNQLSSAAITGTGRYKPEGIRPAIAVGVRKGASNQVARCWHVRRAGQNLLELI